MGDLDALPGREGDALENIPTVCLAKAAALFYDAFHRYRVRARYEPAKGKERAKRGSFVIG
jgi:hypothetical protein